MTGRRPSFQDRLTLTAAKAHAELARRRAADLPTSALEELTAELADCLAVDRAAEERRERAR